MIALTPEARTQLEEFECHYVEQQRPQALRNLGHSLAESSLVILNTPQRGLGSSSPLSRIGELEVALAEAGTILDRL